MNIRKKFHFDAAHQLINVGPDKCRRLHGHTYQFEVEVSGPIVKSMVIDFTDLKRIVKKAVVDRWDHYNINDSMPGGMESTVENIVTLAAGYIMEDLPEGIQLKRIEMFEGINNSAIWEA
jgi:6-pyruvoyl tetrahydropterin synthase/QueD family protein